MIRTQREGGFSAAKFCRQSNINRDASHDIPSTSINRKSSISETIDHIILSIVNIFPLSRLRNLFEKWMHEDLLRIWPTSPPPPPVPVDFRQSINCLTYFIEQTMTLATSQLVLFIFAICSA